MRTTHLHSGHPSTLCVEFLHFLSWRFTPIRLATLGTQIDGPIGNSWLIVMLHYPLYTTFKTHRHEIFLTEAHKAGHVHAYMRTHPVAISRRNPRGPIYLLSKEMEARQWMNRIITRLPKSGWRWGIARRHPSHSPEEQFEEKVSLWVCLPLFKMRIYLLSKRERGRDWNLIVLDAHCITINIIVYSSKTLLHAMVVSSSASVSFCRWLFLLF